jgi:hypothetical protein
MIYTSSTMIVLWRDFFSNLQRLVTQNFSKLIVFVSMCMVYKLVMQIVWMFCHFLSYKTLLLKLIWKGKNERLPQEITGLTCIWKVTNLTLRQVTTALIGFYASHHYNLMLNSLGRRFLLRLSVSFKWMMEKYLEIVHGSCLPSPFSLTIHSHLLISFNIKQSLELIQNCKMNSE